MKYVTTLEVARRLRVSKQTLLNWLYAGKVPEPPRSPAGYRLWSPARIEHLKALVRQGAMRRRTVVHRALPGGSEDAAAYAREVDQFIRDARLDVGLFLDALARLDARIRARLRKRPG